jgi:hypothetical protein
MVPTILEYYMGPLVVSYKFSISHNNGAMTKHGGEHIFLFK